MPKKQLKEQKIKLYLTRGRPMLNWVGKKPLDYVKGFPTQLMPYNEKSSIEVFDPLKKIKLPDSLNYKNLEKNWFNLLFYGDNKDVLATLLEQGFRGKIDLVYIDPPFMSNTDYVRKVELRGLKETKTNVDDADLLQQTMYFDMWRNDAYLQFMYERLILLKELLAETGSIYVHLDWHVGHYVKLLMDEVFGKENFKNEIVWVYSGATSPGMKVYARRHEIILWYSKSDNYIFEPDRIRQEYSEASKKMAGRKKIFHHGKEAVNIELSEKGKFPEDWIYIPTGIAMANEHLGFQTQKPKALLERIIKASSNPDDLVLDCFIGSGTTARVAQKLGRKWIGCDINKGAIQLTSRELQKIILEQIKNKKTKYPSFATYKVNNYDLQLLRTEAIELAVQHIGIQRTKTDSFFDGTLGKNLVKIIDFNHPFTLLDFQLIQDELKKRSDEDRNITVVCLGKELAVDPAIEEWNKKHPVNKIEVIELKTNKKYGNFLIHKPDEVKVKIERKGDKAIVEIKDFISPTIIERLNINNTLFKVKIPDFRAMIDYVLIDTNYDGKTFHIVCSDVPEKKNDLIKGKYELEIPKTKTKIAIKIVDMLGEEIIITKEI